ncbi:hypothetical protein [Actinomadura spongiicola]|uniref:hypothetical protein n=1 Tax=Actinomadura spongiicola TaxID=2303421 RepID=UPI0018F199BC|nr:hypothetical protein [Actinomadura spongiicola]
MTTPCSAAAARQWSSRDGGRCREPLSTATGAPLNGRVEVAGPERFRLDEFFRDALASWNDPREVVTDPHAPYFGAEVEEFSLVPVGAADTRHDHLRHLA